MDEKLALSPYLFCPFLIPNSGYLDEIVPVTTEEGLKSLEANRDQTVWKLATKVYSQSGHKVDLYTIRDLVDFRIEVMKYQVAADKERLAEKARRRDALKADIPARVQKIVIEQLQVDKNRVDLDSSLANDLGMDELDRVELLMALEEEFDIEIPDDVAEDGWDTVKDLVNLVQERLLD